MALFFLKFLSPAILLFFCSFVSAFSNYGYVKFNETCIHSDNCMDYKMVCAMVENDEMKCQCSDMLYSWSDQLQECIMDSDKLRRWLFRVKADNNNLGEVSNNEFNGPFLVLKLCGLFVVLALFMFLALICMIFTCRSKNVSK